MLMAKEGTTGSFLTKMLRGAEVMKDYLMRLYAQILDPGTALCKMIGPFGQLSK